MRKDDLGFRLGTGYVVEAREDGGDRTSFYLCESLPSSVVHAPSGPDHGPAHAE